MRETIELKTIDDNEKVSGKLSEIENLNISQDLINKYDSILYVKDNKLYLDFIAGFPKMQEYINNKNKIEILKDNIEICYDRLKTYNKILNSSFDDGLNNYTQRATSRKYNNNIKKLRKFENSNSYGRRLKKLVYI